jgi:ATP-dependent RNA helicase DOB1
LYEQIQKVKNHFPEGIPILDPIEDMHIRDEDFGKLIRVKFYFFFYNLSLNSCLVFMFNNYIY